MTRDEFVAALRRALGSRRHAYLTLFKGPNSDVVLKDLARFCRAHETTADTDDEKQTYLQEGRREVWLRIQRHLNMSPKDLWDHYSAGKHGPYEE